MVRIETRYEGDLRCRSRHQPSKVELHTDAPVDNQGKGESFSPTDLVATALGSCMLTIMGIVARRHEWDIEGSEAIVEKRMVTEPVRRIGELEVVLRVKGGPFDDRAKQTLERAAFTCPVHQSLHPDIKIPVSFEWLGVSTTAR